MKNATKRIDKDLLTRGDIGNIEDYSRLFRLKGVRLLIDDIYIQVYPDYGFLILIKDGDHIGFFHKKGVEMAASEGFALLESEKNFKKYMKDTENYLKEYSSFTGEFIKKLEYTKEDLGAFFNHLIKLLWFYKFTDCNYTERAYQKATELKDKDFLGRLQEIGNFKNYFRDCLNKAFVTNDSDLNKVLQNLSKLYKISVKSLKEYKYKEVINLVDGSKVDEETISKRSRASILYNMGDKVSYCYGEPAEKIFNEFSYEEDHQNGLEVQGTCASPGIVRGYARVGEADYDDFNKLHKFFEEMKQGEILVCETTSPDLMPAMRKASAFVTNQGGMISHAAIVSREFGIPCIVGTKNGTKIIKTGDLLEVDASKGIVRILRKDDS